MVKYQEFLNLIRLSSLEPNLSNSVLLKIVNIFEQIEL